VKKRTYLGSVGSSNSKPKINHDYQLGTGTRSSLPVTTTLERPEGGRFILGQRKTPVRDLAGNGWKKEVEVEQCAVMEYSNDIIYWKVEGAR
jgi:hypothetical protein